MKLSFKFLYLFISCIKGVSGGGKYYNPPPIAWNWLALLGHKFICIRGVTSILSISTYNIEEDIKANFKCALIVYCTYIKYIILILYYDFTLRESIASESEIWRKILNWITGKSILRKRTGWRTFKIVLYRVILPENCS
jgi:hypothetical protein